MIRARLVRLGYSALHRESFASFQKFKDAREAADALLLAILAEVSKQSGREAALPRQGAPSPEPRELGDYPVWLSFKRLAAHAEEGVVAPPLPAGADVTADELLSPYLRHEKTPAKFPQILLHAESQGLFVPFEFEKPFWVPEPGVSVGSAPRAAEETQRLLEFLDKHAPPGALAKERDLARRLGEVCREAAGELLAAELFV